MKAAARDLDAVEAILVESVRGGLERQVVDAGGGELRELLVELDRIGSGEARIVLHSGGDDPERAEACRLKAELGPDLAGEARDRGLAGGTRDRGDRARLAAVEARSDER